MCMDISGYSSIGVCTWKKSSSMDSTWTTLWRSTNLLHSKYWDSSWSRSVWSQWVTLHRSWNTSTTLNFRSEASGLTPNTETCSKLTLMETFWVLAMDSNSSRRKSWLHSNVTSFIGMQWRYKLIFSTKKSFQSRSGRKIPQQIHQVRWQPHLRSQHPLQPSRDLSSLLPCGVFHQLTRLCSVRV